MVSGLVWWFRGEGEVTECLEVGYWKSEATESASKVSGPI